MITPLQCMTPLVDQLTTLKTNLQSLGKKTIELKQKLEALKGALNPINPPPKPPRPLPQPQFPTEQLIKQIVQKNPRDAQLQNKLDELISNDINAARTGYKALVNYVRSLSQEDIKSLDATLPKESVLKIVARLVLAKDYNENLDTVDLINFINDNIIIEEDVDDKPIAAHVTIIHELVPHLAHILPLLEAIIDLPIVTLDLSKLGLKTLPQSLRTLIDLTELDISHNELTIPLEFQNGDFPKLITLKVNSNTLKTLTTSIGWLTSLQELDLSDNKKLSTLPEEIGLLTNLKTLKVGKCGLRKLTEQIGWFTNLEELNLENNYLEKLPKVIGNLRKLKRLVLDENRLKYDKKPDKNGIPNEIGNLDNLEELYLLNNKATLPESISLLTKLQKLSLRNNNINKLPENFGSLIKLEWLDLADNTMYTLPDFQPGNNLETLLLSNNRLQELPDSIGFLVNLEELDLGSNYLTWLPDTIGALINLKKLNLNRNKLDNLPDDISLLVNLQELDLTSNAFTEFPDQLFSLNHLTILSGIELMNIDKLTPRGIVHNRIVSRLWIASAKAWLKAIKDHHPKRYMTLQAIHVKDLDAAVKILNITADASYDEINNAAIAAAAQHGLTQEDLDHIENAKNLLIKNLEQTEYAGDYASLFLNKDADAEEDNNEEKIKEARKILGVSDSASINEINQAYKSLAMRWHPDKFDQNPANYPGQTKEQIQEIFKSITDAHDILTGKK